MHSDPVAISDDEVLYRLIHPNHLYGDRTVKSVAFRRNGPPDPEISVNVSSLTTVPATLSQSGGRGHCIGELVAGAVRALGLRVVHDPLPGNPAHALVTGATSKTQCQELANQCRVTENCAERVQ